MKSYEMTKYYFDYVEPKIITSIAPSQTMKKEKTLFRRRKRCENPRN